MQVWMGVCWSLSWSEHCLLVMWLNETDLSCLMNSTSCPWWHFLMQFTQMALRSVVLQVWHLWGTQVAFVNDHKPGKQLTRSHLDCEYEHKLPVKIVHWVAGVTWNLVQALTSAHSLFNSILIVHYFIIWKKESRQELVQVGLFKSN